MLIPKTASCLQMLEWLEANHQIVDFTGFDDAEILISEDEEDDRTDND